MDSLCCRTDCEIVLPFGLGIKSFWLSSSSTCVCHFFFFFLFNPKLCLLYIHIIPTPRWAGCAHCASSSTTTYHPGEYAACPAAAAAASLTPNPRVQLQLQLQLPVEVRAQTFVACLQKCVNQTKNKRATACPWISISVKRLLISRTDERTNGRMDGRPKARISIRRHCMLGAIKWTRML